MRYRKLIATVICLIIVLTGCTQKNNESNESDVCSIVTTSFHEYDWVMEILGDNKDRFNVTLLMDSGTDLHSYTPTAKDIAIIKSADLFIYNGGHSHNWVADVISEPTNSNFKAINVMDVLGDVVILEEHVDGMIDEEHDHEHEEDDHDDHDHSHEDEHVWLSLQNAMIICEELANEIGKLDSDNINIYLDNAKIYNNKLSELDKKYEQVVDNSNIDTLIFADRFPFLYLMEEYDINYYAAFSGCSSETEASFETIKFLSKKVDELNIKNIIIIDNSSTKLAETINNSTINKDSEILILDSMQSITKDDIDNGASYYKYMESNLEVIKKALN